MSIKNNNNLVTIVTPLYNSERYISITIESVIKQTFQSWELILVDDCSNDRTVSVVEGYANTDPRIKLIKLEKNVGSAVARNIAINAASGRYIAFLDSDDLWMPKKLDVQINYMKKHDLAFSYMSYYKIDSNGNKTGVVNIPEKVSYNDLLKTCVIGCLTAVYDKDTLGVQTMPLLRKRQDYGLWLKLLKLTDVAYGINQPLSCYRVHSESISSNKLSAAKYQWRIYREVEELNFIMAGCYFISYVAYGFLKSKLPKIYSMLIR